MVYLRRIGALSAHKDKSEFEPQVVAFCCNWCSYGGADLAGVSRFQYPANIRIIRTNRCRLAIPMNVYG